MDVCCHFWSFLILLLFCACFDIHNFVLWLTDGITLIHLFVVDHFRPLPVCYSGGAGGFAVIISSLTDLDYESEEDSFTVSKIRRKWRDRFSCEIASSLLVLCGLTDFAWCANCISRCVRLYISELLLLYCLAYLLLIKHTDCRTVRDYQLWLEISVRSLEEHLQSSSKEQTQRTNIYSAATIPWESSSMEQSINNTCQTSVSLLSGLLILEKRSTRRTLR